MNILSFFRKKPVSAPVEAERKIAPLSSTFSYAVDLREVSLRFDTTRQTITLTDKVTGEDAVIPKTIRRAALDYLNEHGQTSVRDLTIAIYGSYTKRNEYALAGNLNRYFYIVKNAPGYYCVSQSGRKFLESDAKKHTPTKPKRRNIAPMSPYQNQKLERIA